MFTADQLRDLFLEFFQSKQHKVLPSASLVPHGDPTLLLTGAGMIPFKPYFLGQEKPEHTRVTTCQRCVRTPDIDNVGITDRHATFFEMLGNFSFGDYFKEEVIPWAWEFVTEHLKLKKEDLWISIYFDDEEAFNIWHNKVGIAKERIVRLGSEDNFWEIGVGPCGPCSEIHYDRGLEFGCDNPDCKPGCDCERFLEIWNLVFIQFHKDEKGELTPLKSKGIDTGMGMERVAALMQGAKSIFEIDLVRPILDKVAFLANTQYGEDAGKDISLRVITDHVRGLAFLVFDGVLPSNEGRGYILRRLLRRAIRHGKLLGIEREFLLDIIDVVIEQMKYGYPELPEKENYIKKLVSLEERRFNETLDQGMAILNEMIDKQMLEGEKQISGKDAFKLYDTYGFPVELTSEILAEKGFTLDEGGFEKEMEQQRKRARSAHAELGYLDNQVNLYKEIQDFLDVRFIGYENTESEATVVAIIKDDQQVEQANQGDKVSVILDITPFYAESGGQVADTGTITGKTSQFQVTDVRKPVEGVVIHQGIMISGELKVNDKVLASVYNKERLDTARHHTATHLLHRVLKDIIGDHVNQSGSYVSPKRLRFDFTHFESVSQEQLDLIENLINELIITNSPVETFITDIEKARELGAMALFGEKYGDKVRVVSTGHSCELCGGIHVKATGEIGLFRIVSEGSVAAGVRRIEAVAGKSALRYTDEREELLKQASDKLQTKPEDLVNQVERILEQQKDLEQQLREFKNKQANELIDNLVNKAQKIKEISLLVAEVEIDGMDELRALGDKLRARLDPGIVFLGAKSGEKVLLLSMISKKIAGKQFHAGDVIKAAAQACGGGGGGRPDMAQAGGRFPDKLNNALELAEEIFKKQIEGYDGNIAK